MSTATAIALVTREEVADAWFRGLGPWLMVGIALALSGVAVGVAYTAQINLLDAREGVAILVRLALGLGLSLALFSGADAISGGRDRATLESLLLTPVRHTSLVLGKAIAALVWWLVSFAVAAPYVIAVGSGPGGVADAMTVVATAGLALAVFFAFGAVLVSVRARTTVASLASCVVVVGVLAAPALLPATFTRGPIGSVVLRIDPITSCLQLINRVIVDQHAFSAEASWLIGPVVAALAVVVVATTVVRSIQLEPA